MTPEQWTKQLNLNNVQVTKPPIKMSIFKFLEGRKFKLSCLRYVLLSVLAGFLTTNTCRSAWLCCDNTGY